MSYTEEHSIELNHSPVLFLDERCYPLTFIIEPCRDMEAIREMIEVGFISLCFSFIYFGTYRIAIVGATAILLYYFVCVIAS
jgi:hypothetical protein